MIHLSFIYRTSDQGLKNKLIVYVCNYKNIFFSGGRLEAKSESLLPRRLVEQCQFEGCSWSDLYQFLVW